MTRYFMKDPQSVLDYTLDWGSSWLDELETVDTDYGWEVTPADTDDTALVARSHIHDDKATTVSLKGGRAGNIYRVSNRIDTSAGRTAEDGFMLRVAHKG